MKKAFRKGKKKGTRKREKGNGIMNEKEKIAKFICNICMWLQNSYKDHHDLCVYETIK
jgi:hypothetical protein